VKIDVESLIGKEDLKKPLIGQTVSHWDVCNRIFNRFSDCYPKNKNTNPWWEASSIDYIGAKDRWGRWLWLKEMHVVADVMNDIKNKRTPYRLYPPGLKSFIKMYVDKGGLIKDY
jgi:hypothetical protein